MRKNIVIDMIGVDIVRGQLNQLGKVVREFKIATSTALKPEKPMRSMIDEFKSLPKEYSKIDSIRKTIKIGNIQPRLDKTSKNRLHEEYTNLMKSLPVTPTKAIDSLGKYLDVIETVKTTATDVKGNIKLMKEEFMDYAKHAGIVIQRVRRFRMELLGILFAGLALKGVMMGLLQPAMNAYGIFDLMSTLLLVTFAPLMDKLLPVFLSLADVFMNLSPEVQTTIGYLVEFLAIFGTVAMNVAMIGLAFSSLAQWFPVLVGGVSSTSSTFAILSGFISTVGVPILALIAVIGLLCMAWKRNWGNIRQHTDDAIAGIKTILDGIKNVIGGFIDLFVGILDLDGAKISDALERIIYDGLGNIVKGLGKIALAFLDFVFDIGKGIGKWLSELIDKIWTFLEELPLIGRIFKTVRTGVTALRESIKEFLFGDVIPKYVLVGGEFVPRKSVDDFILSRGVLYKTNPADIIMGTKGNGIFNNSNQSITMTIAPTINISGNSSINERVLAEKIGEVVTAQLRGINR